MSDVSGLSLQSINLDVKTPSDTLEVTVRASVTNRPELDLTFSATVTTSRLQTFNLSTPSIDYGNIYAGESEYTREMTFYTHIEGTGTGSVELTTTTTGAEDSDSLVGWNLLDRQIPKVRLEGHPVSIPELLYGNVISSPRNGTSYTEGERIELLFVMSRAVADTEIMSVPLFLGTGAQHRREATFVVDDEITGHITTFLFAYTVKSMDIDADGVLIPANPLGENAYANITLRGNTEVPADLRFPANQLDSSHAVDGSSPRVCQELLCTTVIGASLAQATRTAFRLDSFLTFYPYTPFASSHGISFKYGNGEYAITQIDYRERQEGNSLSVFVYTEIPQSPAERWEFIFGNNRYLYDPSYAFNGRDLALFLTYDGPAWTDGDELDVKILETSTPSFANATYEATEGNTVDVTVTLDQALVETTVTLPITVTANGGATEADYTLSPDELVFAPGETSKTFTVTVVDDTIDDDGESITLGFDDLRILSGGAKETATIVLGDDDFPVLTVEYGQDSQNVDEGETVRVTVRLSAVPEREVSIPITATGQASAVAADYDVPPA